MSKFKDTDYLNISMRIKACENRLMGADAFEKMAECTSPDEAASFAADHLGHPAISAKDFEAMLSSDEIDTYKFIRSNVPDKTLVDIFALRRDYANIKALVKAEICGISPDGMLVGCGTLSAEEAKRAYTERNAKILDGKFLKTILAAQEIYAKTGDPQKIDLVCDELCYADMKETAKNSAFDFMADFIGTKIDVINILSFIRQKIIGKDADFFRESILSGGKTFPPSMLASFYAEGLEAFFAKLERTDFSAIVADISSERPDPAVLEKNADRYICEKIRKMRSTPFGPQVAAGYLAAKEYETKNARIVMSGILSGQDKETITERLRLGYE